MHYYNFHVGDYLSHTAHLEPMEDLAYRRLLDLYYSSEQPISTDVKKVARLIRLPQEPVQLILDEFFQLTDDGYRNARADAELVVYKGFSEAGKRGAAKRWSKPADSPPIAPLVTPPIATNNQEPRTNNQKKNKNSHASVTVVSQFDEIRNAYPKRGGGQKWQDAERAYNARIAEGSTHDQILDGVYRYARFIEATGKVGTEYVQMAATFLGRNKGFLELWQAPAMVKDIRQLSAVERVKLANQHSGVTQDERVVSTQRQVTGSLEFPLRDVWK